MNEFLETKKLSIGYSTKKASLKLIKKLNLSIFSSELVAVLGSNGVGKSTFLKTMAGLLPPISGSVFFRKRNIDELNETLRAKKLVYVPAGLHLNFDLIARDYVALGRTPYLSWNSKLSVKDYEIIDSAMSSVQASHLADRKMLSLSDGEKQKLVLAKALAQETQVIFLDEPTAFLDVANKIEVFILLHKLVNQENKTIVFSTHDLDMAIRFADKLLIFSNDTYEYSFPENLILNGKLEHLFPTELAHLNYEVLHFEPNRELPKNLRLISNSSLARVKLTRNFLIRLFSKLNLNKINSDITIEINDTNWLVINKQDSIKVFNFLDLHAALLP